MKKMDNIYKDLKVVKKKKEKCTFDYKGNTQELLKKSSEHWGISQGHLLNVLVRCILGSNRELRKELLNTINNYIKENGNNTDLTNDELYDFLKLLSEGDNNVQMS